MKAHQELKSHNQQTSGACFIPYYDTEMVHLVRYIILQMHQKH